MANSEMSVDFLQQIDRAIGNDDFEAASQLCEAASAQAAGKLTYWYLGLIALLQEQEADAQAIWLLGMSEGDSDDLAQWTIELAEILWREIQRRSHPPIVRLLRQYFRELVPTDLNNLLHLLRLAADSAEQGELTQAAIELLKFEMPVDLDLLQTTLQDLMGKQAELAANLAEASLSILSPDWIDLLLPQAIEQAALGNLALADRYISLCLQLDPEHVSTLAQMQRITAAQEAHRDSL